MDDFGGGDEGGGGGEELLDPSLLEGDQGGDINPNKALGKGGSGTRQVVNLEDQTLLALQELGIVIGVAIMVASIFMLMVFMEKLFNSVVTKYHKRFGGSHDIADEDPAQLVGTFKRYKN